MLIENVQEDMLSVIIPVHNVGKFLRKTINGILKQSYKLLEVILVENASEDNSLSICGKLSEKDPRVIVLECKDKGTSLARKAGILAAKGKYIVFSDQDDAYIGKNSLEKMVKAIEHI